MRLGVGDGVGDVVGDGVGVAVCVAGFGATRFGGCTALRPGVSNRARAAMITPETVTTPPSAAPRTKAWRRWLRFHSMVRSCARSGGSAARCAAQLLNGAAAMPRVGNRSRPASSGPASPAGLVSAPAMPAVPSSARDVSAQLARSASHHLAFSLVFGVRRNAAFFANRPSIDARATTRDVDCQMKKAPSASRHDAPVPRRSSATARTRPSSTSTGTPATRNAVSLVNSAPPPVARLAAPASRKTRNTRPRTSPYHWTPPDRYAHRWPVVRRFCFVTRPGSSERQCIRRIWMPPKHHR